MNPRKKYRLGYQATPLPSRRSVPPCRAPDDQPSPPPEACWVASAARSAACLAASSSCSADFLAASAPRSDRAQRHRPAAGRTAHRPGLQRLRGGRAHLQPGHVRRSGVPGDDLGAPFRVGRRPRGGPEPGADPVHRGVPAPGPGRAVRAALPDRLQEGGYRSAAPRLPVPGPAAGVDPRARPGRLPPVGRAATDTVRTATR